MASVPKSAKKRKNRKRDQFHMRLHDDVYSAAEKIEQSGKRVKHIFFHTIARDKSFALFNIKILFLIGMVAFKIFYPILFTQYTWLTLSFNLIFVYIILNTAFNIFRVMILSVYYTRHNHEPGRYDDVVVIINRLSFLINHIIYFLIALRMFGLNIITILTSISIFAAAFAFIFRDFIANFLNGFVILFSKNLTIHDYVRMGDYEGRIVDMSFSNVKLLNPNGEEVFIPNTLVLSREFVNLSKVEDKKFAIDFSVPLKFHAEIMDLEPLLIHGLAKKFTGVIRAQDIIFKIRTVDHQQILITLEIYTGKYNFALEQSIRKEASLIILDFITRTEKQNAKNPSKVPQP